MKSEQQRGTEKRSSSFIDGPFEGFQNLVLFSSRMIDWRHCPRELDHLQRLRVVTVSWPHRQEVSIYRWIRSFSLWGANINEVVI